MHGDVEKFEVDAQGFRVAWRVVIRFHIERTSDRAVLFDQRFAAEITHHKMLTAELTNFPSAVLAAYLSRFLHADRVRVFLSPSS